MPRPRRSVVWLCMAALLLLWGCGPSRTYTEGVLSENDSAMSGDELGRYAARLAEETAKIDGGGAVPPGVTREAYREDLKTRRYLVQRQIEMRGLKERHSQKLQMRLFGP